MLAYFALLFLAAASSSPVHLPLLTPIEIPDAAEEFGNAAGYRTGYGYQYLMHRRSKRAILNFDYDPSVKWWNRSIAVDDTELSTLSQGYVDKAIADYAKNVPCLKFHKVSASDCMASKNCLKISYGEFGQGCEGHSRLGRHIEDFTGYQQIHIGECPISNFGVGILVHEIGHSLGLPHTQTRWDRDNYVKILWKNMINITDIKSQFRKISKPRFTDFGKFGYDLDSIMEYNEGAFSKNSEHVIETLNKSDQYRINDNWLLSKGDAAILNYAYGCNKAEVKVTNETCRSKWRTVQTGQTIKEALPSSSCFYNLKCDKGELKLDSCEVHMGSWKPEIGDVVWKPSCTVVKKVGKTRVMLVCNKKTSSTGKATASVSAYYMNPDLDHLSDKDAVAKYGLKFCPN